MIWIFWNWFYCLFTELQDGFWKCQDLHFFIQAALIKELVKLILDKSKIKSKILVKTDQEILCFMLFLRRHSNKEMNLGEKLSWALARRESVYAWFDGFEQFCKGRNITSPDQVYDWWNTLFQDFPCKQHLIYKFVFTGIVSRTFR